MGVNVRLTPGLKARVSGTRRRAELPPASACKLRTGREAELPLAPASGLRTGQGCRAATGTSLWAEDKTGMQSCHRHQPPD